MTSILLGPSWDRLATKGQAQMVQKINLRNAYYPHERVQKDPGGPSMTQQNFRDETDINQILAKYTKTGLLDHVNKYGGQYADMPGEIDFHAAMNLVTKAQTMFAELPSKIRGEFANDPALFLDFVENPENRAAAIEMGLYPPEEPEPAPGEPELILEGDPRDSQPMPVSEANEPE